VTDVIYLDNNATTRPDEEVLAAMLPYLRDQYGNPASGHGLGRAARAAVERAREQVAELIGARTGRVIFVGSATEANNLILKGVAASAGVCRVATTTAEHSSVLAPLRYLEGSGRVRVDWVCPDSFGQVRGPQLRESLHADTRLVSVMAANNVVHTLNPLEEIAAACSETAALFHTDATQLVGRLPLDVERLGIDALSLSAHKLYGPKGVGALYLSRAALNSGLVPLVHGGGQELGLRSGTLNVPAIVGLGTACSVAARRLEDDAHRARELASLLLEELRRRAPGVSLNGHPTDRLPGGLHVTVDGVDARGLMAAVPQVAFSDGSACETEETRDHVLDAIGRGDRVHHSIRLQIGRTTTRAQVVEAAERLTTGARRLKALSD
jgi:cysteine desulfurase